MKRVYTLSDLSKETGIDHNGFQAFLKNGTVIGLYDDTFVAREPGKFPTYLSPSEIIPYVESRITSTFTVSDQKFFDHCKYHFKLTSECEDEFFELPFEEQSLNEWLTSKRIPYKVISCNSKDDEYLVTVIL